MKKKIDSYFSRVTANRHACNMFVGGETFDLKFQAEKEAKENRQQKIDDRVKERREAAKRMRPVERTAEQNVDDELDFIVDGLDAKNAFFRWGNAFANDGLFSVIRDPVELLEMQITATLKDRKSVV